MGKKKKAAKELQLKLRRLEKSNEYLSKRNFREVTALGGQNDDWPLLGIGLDADIWQNIFALRQRSRDLFQTDCYMRKFRTELIANVFGAHGHKLRLNCIEDEDREVESGMERAYLRDEAAKRRKMRAYVEKRLGHSVALGVRDLMYDDNKGVMNAGEPDLYAIKVIHEAWMEWQRAEYATVTGRMTYNTARQIRLTSAARDGDHFIRKVKGPSVNKFGFSLQLINAEYCDQYMNTMAPNGDEVRMGIQYNSWKAPVGYYFIKRIPNDWLFSTPGSYAFGNTQMHDFRTADQIIHYGVIEDADQTRCAPWIASVIPKLRNLDRYEEAEVIAARVEACKGGHYTSKIQPEGGFTGDPMDPKSGLVREVLEPGQWKPLPMGVEAVAHNPTHPNGNFSSFRSGVLRGIAAGIGSSYNILANDLEGVNYSSLRGGMLDEREMWMLLQQFDIDTAERPIFEEWLEMALLMDAIPLPYSKLSKFNRPKFQGRRWPWVDPLKDAQADAMIVQNKFSSRSKICSENGEDWMEVITELAVEDAILKDLGMSGETTAGNPNNDPQKQIEDTKTSEKPDPSKED